MTEPRALRATERFAVELLPWGQPRAVAGLTRWLRRNPAVMRNVRRYQRLDAGLLAKRKARRH